MGARLMIAFFLLWLQPGAVRAGTVAEFLRLGFGARALSLGDGMLSADHDAAALYWNPALLARPAGSSGEVMHTEQFGGLEGYDAFALALPLGTKGETLALGLLRLAVNDIPMTGNFAFDDFGTDGLPGTHDRGEANGRWDPGEPVHADPGSVEFRSDEEWALLLGYARPLGERGSLGLCAKLLRQRLAGQGSSGIGVDLGLHWELPGGFELAVRLRDAAGTRVVWDTGAREVIGPRLNLAAGRELGLGTASRLRASLEAAVAGWDLASGGGEWHGGFEYRWRERLFLRAGSASGQAAFGAGIGLNRFRVDFATQPFHPLGATNRLSALARW